MRLILRLLDYRSRVVMVGSGFRYPSLHLVKYLKRTASIMIIVLVFGYFFQELRVNREILSKISWADHILDVVIQLAALLLMQALMCIAWSWLLKCHNVKLDTGSLIYSYFVPNLGKYIPGKVVFLLGRVELTYRLGGTRAVGMSTFVGEQVFVVLAAGIFVPVCLYSFLDTTVLQEVALYLVMAATYLFVFFRPEVFHAVVAGLLRLLKRPPLDVRLAQYDVVKLVSVYVLVWVLYGGACAYLTIEMADLDYGSFWSISSVFVVAWLLGYLSLFTPGGIGVREAVIVFCLQFYVDSTVAILLALVARITWSIAELALSSLALLIPVKFRKLDTTITT
jgi:hypothetical protein